MNLRKYLEILSSHRNYLQIYVKETNVLGFKGPRKMTVLIPGICDTENYRRKEIRPISVRICRI